ALLKITGDIGGNNTMKFAEEKRSKEDIFQDALKDLHSEPKADATTKKAAAKKAEPKVEEPKAEEAPVEEAKAEEPAATEAPAEDAKA
ncbi:MAG: ribosomal protein, partial [Aeromicrobium sp.]|nr:ribosomal protein [Aeromicrobium sp.]